MAELVEVPDMGEGMGAGLVAEWYHSDGADVAPGQPVCRVECAFVAFEIEATGHGQLRHQKPAGSMEPAGTVLGVIVALGEAFAGAEVVGDPPEGVMSAGGFEDVVECSFEAAAGSSAEEAVEESFESVVVPFPRRFAEAPQEILGEVPEFTSSLFERVPGEPVSPLTEPGGSIPGLPLWEPDDPSLTSVEMPVGQPSLPRSIQDSAHTERFERIAAEAAASAQVLTVEAELELTEAGKLIAACRTEWPEDHAVARIEDVVFRAVALAIREARVLTNAGALVIAEEESDTASAFAKPGSKAFREAVDVRSKGGDAPFEGAEWVLTSLLGLGVRSAAPGLADGRTLAFTLGGLREGSHATMTMAYGSAQWSEGSAARLLTRIRELIESPYAMLV